MSANEFHIHLYGQHLNGSEAIAPDPVHSDPLKTDSSPASPTRAAPLPSSFEAAQERLLERIPEVLLEPDGSLAWAGKRHQIVGILYDREERIQYVELRGRCDRRQLRTLVEALAGTDQIDDFAVMTLPQGQWKKFQSFETSLPATEEAPGEEGRN